MHLSRDVTLGILAGGRGSRLRYRDKGLLTINGVTLAGRLAATWGQHCHTIIINHSRNAYFYRSIADKQICDRRQHEGPCTGVCALLYACETPAILIAPVDLAVYPDNIPQLLLRALDGHPSGVFLQDRNQHHQMVMLLRTEMLAPTTEFLCAGGDSAWSLIRYLGLHPVTAPSPLKDVDRERDLDSSIFQS